MANIATVPAGGQILVNIEDLSMLKDIKKAISLLRGVGKITVPPPAQALFGLRAFAARPRRGARV